MFNNKNQTQYLKKLMYSIILLGLFYSSFFPYLYSVRAMNLIYLTSTLKLQEPNNERTLFKNIQFE